MDEFDCDLHIHSPHSIGVSKQMLIPNLVKGAQRKGLSLIGTGDATHPRWLHHLEKNLNERDEQLVHNGVSFVLTVEIEDNESIHHLIILPNFEEVKNLRHSLASKSPNINSEWGGRPRVNLTAEELAGIISDHNGLIGPAHVFTPYRSMYREGKYSSLLDCYGVNSRIIHYVELGLSADTEIADCIPELRNLTYLTSSDAHSPSPDKLGREFVRLRMEQPVFSELAKALKRSAGRGPTLNVGFNPKLGKYYLSYCSSCRRTLRFHRGEGLAEYDNESIYFPIQTPTGNKKLLTLIHERKLSCPACGRKMRLGVRDRAMMLGNGESKSPSHRPPYHHMPPLMELIRAKLGVKSTHAKAVRELYGELLDSIGSEIHIMMEASTDTLASFSSDMASVIVAYRNNQVHYKPGGGGKYGSVDFIEVVDI